MSSNGGFPIVILVYRSVIYSYLACPRVGSGSLGSTTAVPTSEISQEFWRKTPELMMSCPKIQAIVWVNIRKSKHKNIWVSACKLGSRFHDISFGIHSYNERIILLTGMVACKSIYMYIYNCHHQQSIYFVSTCKVHYICVTLSKLKAGKLSVQLAPTRTVFRAASDHIKHLGKVSQYPQFSKKTWVPHSTTTHEWWNLSSSLPCWLGGCPWIFRAQGSWPC